MRMKSVWGLLIATLLIGAMLSCANSSTTGATGTGFVWVATEGNQQVQAFNINLNNGSVGAVGSSQSTGIQPSAMALTPDGKTLFVANTSDSTIDAYPVSSDGSLGGSGGATPTMVQGPSGCTTNCEQLGLSPVAMTIDPGGKFLFVGDQGQPNNSSAPGGISVFAISGSSLSLVGPACPANFSQTVCPVVIVDPTTNFGTGPSALVTSPSGNFLYLANQSTNTVEAFSYDASTGALLPLNTYTTGSNPSGLAFSRCAGITQGTASCPAADGNDLFVTNSGSNNISIFTACIQLSTTCSVPNGSLVQVSTSPVAAGDSPVAVFVHPLLGFVYAVNSKGNNVTQYRYSSATGALTTLTPTAVNAGSNPFGGGITSDGTYVFISNNNGSSMSVFNVGPGGKLAPGGTASVTLAGQPSAILVR
jgi:6-phosphogluconolactonase (cycloisomerase 2 family)